MSRSTSLAHTTVIQAATHASACCAVAWQVRNSGLSYVVLTCGPAFSPLAGKHFVAWRLLRQSASSSPGALPAVTLVYAVSSSLEDGGSGLGEVRTGPGPDAAPPAAAAPRQASAGPSAACLPPCLPRPSLAAGLRGDMCQPAPSSSSHDKAETQAITSRQSGRGRGGGTLTAMELDVDADVAPAVDPQCGMHIIQVTHPPNHND